MRSSGSFKSLAYGLVLWLYIVNSNLYSQVINIENKRFLNDTNGWVGNTDLFFNIDQNTQQSMSFGHTFRGQYQFNRHRFLMINDMRLVRGGNTDYVNSGYQHFRYSFKIYDFLTMESFTQTQYNPVLKLDFRYLYGLGPRFKLIKEKNSRAYLGILYMYEFDKIRGESSVYEHRMSSYLTGTVKFLKTVELSGTVFYQPKIGEGTDYRLAIDAVLDIQINKYLSFRTGLNLLKDTRQPIGVPNLVYYMRNGISIKF